MPKTKSLTKKELLLIKHKVNGVNNVDAGVLSGTKSRASASVYASRTLAKPHVQEALTNAMAKAGLSVAKIGKLIHNGATEATSLNGPKSVEHADWGARAKYTDMALKVMGGYAPAKIDANVKLGIIDLVEAAKMKREGDE